jgi:hypothetical protein
MSADPFANTTTVKNILQHIISPKIVSNGSGGYVTKTDLINVDNLLFTAASTTAGTVSVPLTSQCGTVTLSTSNTVRVYHSRVTPNSVILANVQTNSGVHIVTVEPLDGSFKILVSASGFTLQISWFIASF